MFTEQYTVQNTDRTKTKWIDRDVLEQLRMLMDWQIRNLGYDSDSVRQACQNIEDKEKSNDHHNQEVRKGP